MPEFKVIWEIELEVNSALEAAKMAQEYHRDQQSTANKFFVQDSDNGFIFSIDLDEETDEKKVLSVPKYLPLIR
jgi:hypothetical protein